VDGLLLEDVAGEEEEGCECEDWGWVSLRRDSGRMVSTDGGGDGYRDLTAC